MHGLVCGYNSEIPGFTLRSINGIWLQNNIFGFINGLLRLQSSCRQTMLGYLDMLVFHYETKVVEKEHPAQHWHYEPCSRVGHACTECSPRNAAWMLLETLKLVHSLWQFGIPQLFSPLLGNSEVKHSPFLFSSFKGLVTNYWEGGGGYKTGGGASEVSPLQKGGGGAEIVLAMLKGGGGHKMFLG